MTVCIATLIPWMHDEQLGMAVLTASDRMLTAGDIQYEPTNYKVSFLSNTVMLMVAGDMTIQTEALLAIQEDKETKNLTTVKDFAENYAHHIRRIRLKRASELYLSPLGLDGSSFLEKQRNMVQQLVFDLTNELRSYSIEVEALVVGCDDSNRSHIFQIDAEGIVTYHHDIAFAAIGIGSGHAKSYLMFSRYSKLLPYFKALPLLYGAKRRAEVAPGVGKESDFFLITKNGTEPIMQQFIDIIAAAYELEETRKSAAALELEDQLTKFVRNIVEQEQITGAQASDAVSPSLDQPATSAPIPPQEAPIASIPAKIPPRSRRHRSPRRAR